MQISSNPHTESVLSTANDTPIVVITTHINGSSPALNCASAHSLGNFRVGSILLKKDFEGGLRAILIQGKHTTENIDSRNCPLGVKNCTLTVGHRLFQQHRSNPEVTAPQHSWPVHLNELTRAARLQITHVRDNPSDLK